MNSCKAVENSNEQEELLSLNDKIILIEESRLDQTPLFVITNKGEVEISPSRIVYFDGALNLIGERAKDQILMSLRLDEIISLKDSSRPWSSCYSFFDVEDFISSTRTMSDDILRLILKVYKRENFDSNIPYQFLENSCSIANNEGQYIWAATIEPNEDILSWIYKLGDSVEILDPKGFKAMYLDFCEQKLKKLA